MDRNERILDMLNSRRQHLDWQKRPAANRETRHSTLETGRWAQKPVESTYILHVKYVYYTCEMHVKCTYFTCWKSWHNMRRLWEIHGKYIWITWEIYVKYVWNTHISRGKFRRISHVKYMENMQGLWEIHEKYIWITWEICVKYVWNTCKIHIFHMLKFQVYFMCKIHECIHKISVLHMLMSHIFGLSGFP